MVLKCLKNGAIFQTTELEHYFAHVAAVFSIVGLLCSNHNFTFLNFVPWTRVFEGVVAGKMIGTLLSRD